MVFTTLFLRVADALHEVDEVADGQHRVVLEGALRVDGLDEGPEFDHCFEPVLTVLTRSTNPEVCRHKQVFEIHILVRLPLHAETQLS